jgi:hypothetical protein
LDRDGDAGYAFPTHQVARLGQASLIAGSVESDGDYVELIFVIEHEGIANVEIRFQSCVFSPGFTQHSVLSCDPNRAGIPLARAEM